jgi:hypothetical protein
MGQIVGGIDALKEGEFESSEREDWLECEGDE